MHAPAFIAVAECRSVHFAEEFAIVSRSRVWEVNFRVKVVVKSIKLWRMYIFASGKGEGQGSVRQTDMAIGIVRAHTQSAWICVPIYLSTCSCKWGFDLRFLLVDSSKFYGKCLCNISVYLLSDVFRSKYRRPNSCVCNICEWWLFRCSDFSVLV